MTDLAISHDVPAEDVAAEPEPQPLAPIGWRVDSEDRAAYAVDKVLSARERLDRLSKQAAKVLDAAEKDVARTEDFFCGQLDAWLQQNPPAHGRTRHLLTGSVSHRTVSGGLRVTDAEAAVAWAKANIPAAVRRKITESVVVAEVAAHLRTSGSPTPSGFVVAPDSDRLYVNAPKKG